MKKILVIIISCILFVGCGVVHNKQTNKAVTEEDVNEIVDRAIQENNEELEMAQVNNPEEESDEALKTSDGKFDILVNSNIEQDVVSIVENYESYDVVDEGETYLHTLKCVNSTGKTIKSIQVGMALDGMEFCTLTGIAPGDEMVFEYHFQTETIPETIIINEVVYE